MRGNLSHVIYHIQLLTLVVGSRPQPGCPDWASEGAEAFAAVGGVHLGPLGLEQQVEAAGWQVLQGDPADQPSVALPVTAAQGAGWASAAGLLEASGLQAVSAAGSQTVAFEFEVNLPGFSGESPGQREVSGLEQLPDLVAVAELQVLGQPQSGQWSQREQGWQIAGTVQEVGLEAVGAAEMGDFDHLQEKI